jgi:Fur family ferric uptake transcriptional regulator
MRVWWTTFIYRAGFEASTGKGNWLVMVRNTAQRRAIRKVLVDSARPLSPAEILAAAQSDTPGLGIATVYRTVKSLVDEGVLAPVCLPGEAPRYEIAGKGHHHHFHCRHCKGVFEVEHCFGDFQKSVPTGFLLESHEVVLYGLCNSCSRIPKVVSAAPARVHHH